MPVKISNDQHDLLHFYYPGNCCLCHVESMKTIAEIERDEARRIVRALLPVVQVGNTLKEYFYPEQAMENIISYAKRELPWLEKWLNDKS